MIHKQAFVPVYTASTKQQSHLLYLTSSKTPVGCNWLLHPKLLLHHRIITMIVNSMMFLLIATTSFHNQLPLIIITFKRTVILQKCVNNLPSQLLHLGQTLHCRSTLPCILVPFGMQSIDQFLQFVDICLLAQTSTAGMLAVAIS